jgi:hypothetical protein
MKTVNILLILLVSFLLVSSFPQRAFCFSSGYERYMTRLVALRVGALREILTAGQLIMAVTAQAQIIWMEAILGIQVAAAAATSLAMTLYPPLWALKPYEFYITTLVRSGTSYLVSNWLSGWASEPENRHGGTGTGYSAVWEEWGYPTGPFDDAAPFVSIASGAFDLLWKFNKDSADTFQIIITASVEWGEIVKYHHDYTDGYRYSLWGVGTTSSSLVLTVYA